MTNDNQVELSIALLNALSQLGMNDVISRLTKKELGGTEAIRLFTQRALQIAQENAALRAENQKLLLELNLKDTFKDSDAF